MNVMNEWVTRPAFGVKFERFSGIGYHPGLEVRPGTHRSRKLGPGRYNWNKPLNIISKVPRWKAQEKTQEFSKRLGYIGDHILKRRKWLSTINGPGWQDIPSLSLDEGFTFSRSARFPVPKLKAYAVPGPGTYGKNHVPFTRTEEKSKSKGYSFSTLSSFEQYSKAPRSMTTQRSYHLPPNLYKIKTSVQELLSKSTSKRGPYDLFTGERFPERFVYKHTTLRPKVYSSDLNHPKNAFKGIFLRCGKDSQVTSRLAITDISLCKKSPLDPAPNHYDPFPARVVPQSVAPFNSSSVESRPVIKCGFSAPPGRYNHEYKRNILGDGMKSAFLSKVKRTLPQQDKVSWFQ